MDGHRPAREEEGPGRDLSAWAGLEAEVREVEAPRFLDSIFHGSGKRNGIGELRQLAQSLKGWCMDGSQTCVGVRMVPLAFLVSLLLAPPVETQATTRGGGCPFTEAFRPSFPSRFHSARVGVAEWKREGRATKMLASRRAGVSGGETARGLVKVAAGLPAFRWRWRSPRRCRRADGGSRRALGFGESREVVGHWRWARRPKPGG